MKVKLFVKNGEKANQIGWGLLSFSIKHDVQMHMRLLENTGLQSDKLKQELALSDCIASAIALSQCHFDCRTMLFRKLYPSLLRNRRFVRDCIGKSFANKLEEKETLRIMPLLKFCIENFYNFMHHIHESKTAEDEKLKMTEYRRSLLITNHFQNADYR